MKHIRIYILSLLSILLIIISCRDEDTLVLNPDKIPHGIMVCLDEITSPVLNVTDLENSAFEADFFVPSDNVDTYVVMAQRISSSVSEWAEVKRIADIPKNFSISISATEIANALGIDLNDLLPGDEIDFNAYAIGDNGDTAYWENLDQDLGTNPGQKQGFRYVTYVSCPFVAAEITGIYKLIEDEAEIMNDSDSTIILNAGPGENQITIVDMFHHPDPDNPGSTYNVIVDVDPVTGIATVENQNAWNSDNWGWGLGVGTIEGGGFVFSCTGLILLTLEQYCGGTDFGAYKYTIIKQ